MQNHPSLRPLCIEDALDLPTWRYPPPYDCYDLSEADPNDLLRPELDFHAVELDGRLIGFRSFGPDGRVPGWSYDDAALDTGGGLRPELTGQGLGGPVIAAGLAYGERRRRPRAWRMTIATFNLRALTTVRRLGFESIGTFSATTTGREYQVVVREAFSTIPGA